MENVNTKFGPNHQSVCPVIVGHLQQALGLVFLSGHLLRAHFLRSDLSFKAPIALFVRLKTQLVR